MTPPAPGTPATGSGPPGTDPPGVGEERAGRALVAFARALRNEGLAVPVGSVAGFAEAVGVLGAARRETLYWAGRATLVRRPEDIAVFDRVFAAFWLGEGPGPDRQLPDVAVSVALDDGPDGADDAPAGERSVDQAVRFSAVETLAEKDFADYSAEEWAQFAWLLARLRTATEMRRARRRRPDPRQRGHPDLRRTVRRALRTDGEPVERAWRRPGVRPRRVVLLVDVSGSMEPYARALMRFAHAAVAARGVNRCEVFTLGTRLTRVTRELGDRDPDAALRAASAVVADWSGGTRLGTGLAEFNDRWGTRGTARQAIVVILSDGWDRGDPGHLAEEMARLRRVASRIVWVNPLKASPGYAPLARGMAAALPYVDDFVEGHSFAAFVTLASVIAGSSHREGSTP